MAGLCIADDTFRVAQGSVSEAASVGKQHLCRSAIEVQDWGKLGDLMDSNFDARRRMFGDAVLGDLNIKMVTELRRAGGTFRTLSSSQGTM